VLEVRRIEKAWSFRDLGQGLTEARPVAEPDLPLSGCGFDRDSAWISATPLYGLAAKAARIELNSEFLGSHVPYDSPN
jgi:hypothetical protein